MFRIGELVKWRCPQEPMYSYGVIVELRKRWAVIECRDYYDGLIVEVHLRYLRKVERGGKGFGGSKKHSK